MQVRITFSRAEDEEDIDKIYLLIDLLIERVDELLYRTPDYVVRGKRKITITFYALSRRETDIILEIARAEIGDGLIDRATPIDSSMEESLGSFTFSTPEYKKGVKEQLEARKGFKLNVQKLVGNVILTSAKVLARESYKEYEEDTTAPLSTMAVHIYDAMKTILELNEPEDPDELEDFITRTIANEPMYKERRPRRARNRAKKDKDKE